MPGEAFKPVLLHFLVRAIGSPAILRHPVDCGHYARAMASSLAVDEYGLVGRIIYEFQEPCDGGFGWFFRCRQRYSIELHPSLLDQSLFVRPSIGRQVNYCPDTEDSQVP